jgi:DNA-binding transcriptional MerR regulator
MATEGFRGPQVCSIVGITYRQLDYWARTGLLRPSLADAHGSGSQRLYSYTDLLELKVIKQLLDAGVKLQQARRAIECLRAGLGADLATANLVLAGQGSILVQTGEEIVDLLRGGQGVFNIVPLAPVVGELDAAILDMTGRGATAPQAGSRTESQSAAVPASQPERAGSSPPATPAAGL